MDTQPCGQPNSVDAAVRQAFALIFTHVTTRWSNYNYLTKDVFAHMLREDRGLEPFYNLYHRWLAEIHAAAAANTDPRAARSSRPMPNSPLRRPSPQPTVHSPQRPPNLGSSVANPASSSPPGKS